MKSKYKKLLSVYEKIPKIECKGLCHETCTIAPAAKIEIKRAKDAMVNYKALDASKEINRLMESGDVHQINHCAALKNGRCSIYRYRPTICRLYGVAEGLECEFGCKPTHHLSRSEARAILNEVESL